ncbi:GNAT family N-acetyltransferase [Nocardioides bruguierae]|uniref:GNAT family N-acetyltransferase n=1 Tax=Nocardioides bruguierae TaxID=2945102 RepID=A0A9X2D660_9ACTN|nr:GNAT family N-acetyltransferase [Nocardioides bruguierae]MCM0620083.1 GNAT family N-acetyltransferase [Nocardioides bruguierae]
MNTQETLCSQEPTFLPLESEDGPLLQAIYDRTPRLEDLFETVGAADAQSTYMALPEGLSFDNKYLVGAWVDGELAGAADVITSYPTPENATCGLLLIDVGQRGKGVGTALLAHVEEVVRQRGARTLTMLVQCRNILGGEFLSRRRYAQVDDNLGRVIPYRKPLI